MKLLKDLWIQQKKINDEALITYNEFIQWCVEIRIYNIETNKWNFSNLKLEDYANRIVRNEINTRYFSYMAESFTSEFGHPGGTANKFGIYRAKNGNYIHKANEINGNQLETIFKEILKELQCIADDVPRNTKYIGPQMARKIAFLIHPNKYLPIFDEDLVNKILELLDCDKLDENLDFKLTSPLVQYLSDNHWIENLDPIESKRVSWFLLNNLPQSPLFILENTIFYGPPGTGKTYAVQKIIETAQFEFVQFHPSYSYEDFMEGLRPIAKNNAVTLELQSGKFKIFCKQAAAALFEYRKSKPNGDDYPKYYFVADEINRAELSRVFGDVLVCIEQSKRFDYENGDPVGFMIQTTLGHIDNEINSVIWKNGKSFFGVPKNLFFIGTMNVTDRSIDTFDLALRRRFKWVKMECDYKYFFTYFSNQNTAEYIKEAFYELNKLISHEWGLGENFEIGHAFITHLGQNIEAKRNILTTFFNENLAPLLREYLRSDYSENDVKNKIIQAKNTFLKHGTIR